MECEQVEQLSIPIQDAVRVFNQPGVQDDWLYGGALLCESAANVTKELTVEMASLKDRLSCLHIQEAWSALVQELFEQYAFEKIILTHGLLIDDYRPRTNFSVLPNDSAWQTLEYSPATSRGFHVRYWVNGKVLEELSRRRILVLLPIENGYRRTFQSLACLFFDLRALHGEYTVEFHVCVNFSDDNTLNEVLRFTRTLASCRDLSLVLYHFEDPNTLGAKGRSKRWFKTLVLNSMLHHIGTLRGPTNWDEEDKVVLHFQDDDVQFDFEQNVIKSNIKFLRENTEVNIVSGVYSSDEMSGFSLVSSVRKAKRYLSALGTNPVLNLYGGCMTTTLARLRRVLRIDRHKFVEIPLDDSDDERVTSEDAFLSYSGNLGALKDALLGKDYKLLAYARPEIIVRHSEEANVVSWAKRLLRDDRWGRQAAAIVADKYAPSILLAELEGVFSRCRSTSFQPIGKKIAESKCVRDMLADKWNHALRKVVRSNAASLERSLSQARWVDWGTQKTQHQICRDIVSDRKVFNDVLAAARRCNVGYEFVHELEKCEGDRSIAFPILSRILASTDRRGLDGELRVNRHLFRWHAIAEESASLTYQLLEKMVALPKEALAVLDLSADRATELKRRFPIDPLMILKSIPGEGKMVREFEKMKELTVGSGASIDRRPAWRRESYTGYYQNSETKPLFFRFYPVVGRGRFLEASPRRRVYLQLLGENATREVQRVAESAGSCGHALVNLPKTVYPALEQAMISYAGPEQRTISGRFSQMFYVQERISQGVHRLWKAKLRDQQGIQLAQCLGAFLGQIHGSTIGLRPYLKRQSRVGSVVTASPREHGEGGTLRSYLPIADLFLSHLTQIRFFETSVYQRWLEGGAYRPGSIATLLRKIEEGPGAVGSEVEGLIHHDGTKLGAIWKDTCSESARAQEEFGTMGHMGLYSSNIYVGLSGKENGWESKEYRGQDVYIAKEEREDFSNNVQSVSVPNHAGIALIDPAVEAGFLLDELISARLSTAVVGRTLRMDGLTTFGDLPLTTLRVSFVAAYRKALRSSANAQAQCFFPSDPQLSEKRLEIEIRGINSRLNRVAAIWLLARYHDRREYNLGQDERRRLVQVCVDLLHEGFEFQ